MPTSGGAPAVCSAYSGVSAATDNAASIKATSGIVYGIVCTNVNAAIRYLKLYNKATAPAPATDNALLVLRLGIPGNTAGAGIVFSFGPDGVSGFSSGIGVAIVTGSSDTDNTSVAAGDVIFNVLYI